MYSVRLALAIVFGAGWMGVPLRAELTVLDLKRPVEGALAGGESREYAIALKAGQYARIAVEQRSINVAITVFSPDLKERFTEDSDPIGDDQAVEMIADLAGTYRVRIRIDEKAPSGPYDDAVDRVGVGDGPGIACGSRLRVPFPTRRQRPGRIHASRT